MRSLKRNQKKIWYANLIDTNETVDEYGNYTGENAPVYGEKKALDIYVSANTGEISSQIFGNLTDYDRVMSISDISCQINEDSILWIDCDITKSHNFIVKKMSKSLNETLYAIKQVTVNGKN